MDLFTLTLIHFFLQYVQVINQDIIYNLDINNGNNINSNIWYITTVVKLIYPISLFINLLATDNDKLLLSFLGFCITGDLFIEHHDITYGIIFFSIAHIILYLYLLRKDNMLFYQDGPTYIYRNVYRNINPILNIPIIYSLLFPLIFYYTNVIQLNNICITIYTYILINQLFTCLFLRDLSMIKGIILFIISDCIVIYQLQNNSNIFFGVYMYWLSLSYIVD